MDCFESDKNNLDGMLYSYSDAALGGGRIVVKWYVLIDLTQQVTISCNSPKYRTASMR